MDARKFESTEKLYHYTSFDNALKILLLRELRFSRLSGMNDIYESSKHIGIIGDCNNIADITETFNKEIRGYQQISLSIDDHAKNRFGFDLPAMWGHYAEKGNGVCLVLNKKKLLKKLNAEWLCGTIVYEDNLDNWILAPCSEITDINKVPAYIRKNREQLFLTKTKDWEYEQEFRIICQSSNQEYLSVKGCVMCVLLCHADRDVPRIDHMTNILINTRVEVGTYCNWAGYKSIWGQDRTQWYPYAERLAAPSE